MMVNQIIDKADSLDDNSTHGFRRRRFPHQLAETRRCLNRAAHFDDPNQHQTPKREWRRRLRIGNRYSRHRHPSLCSLRWDLGAP